MEKVDIYNCRHEYLGYSKPRKEVAEGEYRLSAFIWIMNDKNEILIQQRLHTAKHFPDYWEVASGGVDEGESALDGIMRELKEELGYDADVNDLVYLGSHIRIRDFVEVFFMRKNIDETKLKYKEVEEVEVQDVKWVTVEEFEKMVEREEAVDTSFNIFKPYYDKVILGSKQ